MLLLSGVFILNASGLQYRTLIHKAMQFRHLALAELCGTVVTFCVTVGLATCGHGVWALAWGALAGSVTATGSLLWIGLRHHHRPALTYRHNELSGFYRFGLYQMAEGAVSQIASQADVLIIGKTLGAEAAGVYSIAKTAAQRLISLINPIVTKIALPLMAQLQDDPERLRRAYLRTVSYATLVSYPCFILLAVVAEPFVAIAFGSRWAEATPVLQLLCIYFLIRAAGNPIGSLVLAKGRADLSFRWNALLAVVLPAVVIVGLPWGADGVAAALAVAIVLLRWPSWRMMVHPLCGARFGEYMSNLTRPLALAVVAGAVALPALLLKNDALQIAVAACLASATYVLLLRRFQPVFLADLMTMVLPRQRVQKRSGPPI
jgi:O-antigen/teichoic acid export membrane protein